jgi:vacuolar-type H+-ATPase subunit C/Vma6
LQLLKKNLSSNIDTPSREQFDKFLRSVNYNLSDFVCVFEKSEFEPFVSKLEKDYIDGKFNKSYIDDLDLLLEHMYAKVY